MSWRVALVLGVVAGLVAGPARADAPPWLGVIIADSPNGDCMGPHGACVIEVIPGTPADEAGVVIGDVVTHVGGQPVLSSTALINRVKALKVGDKTRVRVARADTVVDLDATLTARLDENEIFRRRIIDRKLQPFKLPVLVGRGSGASTDYTGEVLVLLFTSTVCSAECRTVTDAVEALRVTHAGRALSVLGVVPHNVPETLARKLVRDQKVGFTILQDETLDLVRTQTLRANALPVAVVVDRRGFVRYAGMGKSISVEDIDFAVTRALGKSAKR